jgi:hypothetical protein
MSEKKPEADIAGSIADGAGKVFGCVLALSVPMAFAGGIALLAVPVEQTFPAAYAVGGALLGISVILCVCGFAVCCFFVKCFKLPL